MDAIGKLSSAFLALLGFAAALSGCSQQTIDSAKRDTERNIAQARPQADKLALQSRVTAALTAASLSPAVHVRADADGVYLRGTVSSAADKARAGQIARDTLGPGKIVHNQLTVGGQ